MSCPSVICIKHLFPLLFYVSLENLEPTRHQPLKYTCRIILHRNLLEPFVVLFPVPREDGLEACSVSPVICNIVSNTRTTKRCHGVYNNKQSTKAHKEKKKRRSEGRGNSHIIEPIKQPNRSSSIINPLRSILNPLIHDLIILASNPLYHLRITQIDLAGVKTQRVPAPGCGSLHPACADRLPV